jgi:hypothetical protein
LHDQIDALVAEAYGWPADLSDDEILARLVALNAERAAEEKRGLVRWLRPDYQRARAGVARRAEARPDEEQLEASLVVVADKEQKPLFPVGDVERTAAVFAALGDARGPLDAKTLARSFRQGAKAEPAIARVLASLARLGHITLPRAGIMGLAAGRDQGHIIMIYMYNRLRQAHLSSCQ